MESHDQPDQLQTAQRQQSKLMNEIWEWTKAVIIAVVIVLLIRHFLFNLSVVQGPSMEPTLQEGQRLFVNKIIYYFAEPKRGDIVILKDPRGFDQYLVKRVVGAPGDQVEIYNQVLYVNGEPVIEEYTDSIIEDGDFAATKVPEGHYFLMGDNRKKHQSVDSRNFGSVPSRFIKGRADFIVWPPSQIGGLSR